MNKFTKNSIAIFLNFSFTVNQLFSQVQPPQAAQWVPYATGPKGEPGWWAGRGATNAAPEDDYAALKQGQLKHFTRKAVEEINTRYATNGGAGAELNQLIRDWVAAHPDAKDQDLVVAGQLKWVANKVHSRLKSLGVAPEKPQWLKVATGDDQIANLGQLKTAFNFITTAPLNIDADGDGMPDAWEILNGSDPNLSDATGLLGGTSHFARYISSLLPSIPGDLKTIPALTLDTDAPHQAVGAIKGSLAVGGDGSASYSVPIDIPKGTGGMEPKLSLGYSSNGGNGVVGVGWNLGGLQTITRGPATVAKDTFFDPVDFDANDRFFLDGERLVCVSGTYGVAGSEYRIEVDSYGRITYDGNRWKVETKAGLIVMLGETANAQVVAPGFGTLSWGVNRVSDTLGNYYDVVYDRAPATGSLDIINFRVQTISYTGNSRQNIAPYCSVRFGYGTRPDKTKTFTTHASYLSDSRLTEITVSTGSFTNHSYGLGYENSNQTGRSFLKSITKYAKGIRDANHTVPPTKFTYDGLQSDQAIWGPSTDIGLPQILEEDGKDSGVAFLDINSDALPDFSSWRAIKYNENFTSPKKDGTTPLVPVTEGAIHMNRGSGTFAIDNTFRPFASLPLGIQGNKGNEDNRIAREFNYNHHLVAQPIDIDGDGQLDLMGSMDIKQTIRVRDGDIQNRALSNRYQFYTLVGNTWTLKPGWDLPFRLCNELSSGWGGNRRDEHFQFTDLNFDGYPDLILHTGVKGFLSGNATLGNSKGTVFFNNGKNGPGWSQRNSAALPIPLLVNGKDEGRRLVDLNGDGSPELLAARFESNNGLKTSMFNLKIQPNPINAGDRSDWTEARSGSDYGRYMLPTGLIRSNDRPTAAMLLDVNGDGLVDILNSVQEKDKSITKWTSINRGSRKTTSDNNSWAAQSAPKNWTEQESNYTFPYPLFYEKDQDGISNIATGFEAADLNGDGLVDFLIADCDHDYAIGFGAKDRNLAFINTGTGWMKRANWGSPGTSPVMMFNSADDRKDGKRNLRLQDLNGDGFPDLIVNIRKANAANGTGGPQVRYNQCRSEVLTSVQDGLGLAGNGNVLNVSYHRLNDPTATPGFGSRVYEKYAGPTPLPRGHSAVIDSRLVVSRYSEPDGVVGVRWRSQRYGDLRYDRTNEASLGFGWIDAKDEFNAQTNLVVYRQDYPFAGSPDRNQSTIELAEHHINGSPGLASVVPGISTGPKCLATESSTYAVPHSTATIRRPVQTGSVKTSQDLLGHVVSQTITSQTFDEYGFVTASTATALDGSTVTTQNTYAHVIDATRWHLGRLSASAVTKSGFPGTTGPVTKRSAFTYDSTTGLLLSETIEPGTAFASTKTYTHDGFGNVLSTTVTAGSITRKSTSTYDAEGRFMLTASNQLGHTLKYSYDRALALLTSTTDIVGRVTSLSYDLFGTLRYAYLPDGTQIGESTGFATNASLPPAVAGFVTNPIVFFRAKQASASPVGKAYFDALGREIVNETTILRNASETDPARRYAKVYTLTTYDKEGRKRLTSQPFGVGDNPNFSRIDYDALSRVLRVTHPDGAIDQPLQLLSKTLAGDAVTSSTGYSERMSYSKLQNRASGKLERWEDTHGRLVQSRDPSGQTTRFYHDQEGRLLSVAIDDKTLLTNTFDLLGNKISVSEANSGTSTSAYNALGEVTSSTNARGQTTTFTYDAAGRPETVTKPNDGTATKPDGGTFTTHYVESDTPASIADAKALGKPYKTTGPAGYQELIKYDHLARPTSTVKTQFGESFATATAYDVLSRPHAAADAGGLIVVHRYDSTYSFPTGLDLGPGKLSQGTSLWKAGIYDSRGNVISQSLALGVGTAASYDPKTGNVTALAASQSAGDVRYNGTPLQAKIYEWDPLGNLTKRTDTITKRIETFTYDGLNRVITAASTRIDPSTSALPAGATFGYDAKGNLTSKAGASLAYNDLVRPHAVTSATVKGAARTYQYDAAGYVTSDSKRTYTWSSFGQIKSLDYPSAPALQTLGDPDTAPVQTYAGMNRGHG